MRRSATGLAPMRTLVARLAPGVGGLLALPAIGKARVLDDHVLELLARGGDPSVADARGSDLFQFASGTPSDNLRLIESGSLLPWWADPELKITFFRPLSSLLHRLDFALWASCSELMYVHSLLWLVLLLALVSALYSRLEPTTGAATLAGWLYAVNDANGPVASWLCNRNALVSAAAVIGTLLWHQRAREGHALGRLLAAASFACALFAGELGLSAWAFLAAYALVLERGALAQRLASLWPYAVVTLIWAFSYLASGAGTRGSGVYLHPLADPLEFARALPLRMGSLLGAAFGPIPADLVFLAPGAFAWGALAAAASVLAALAWVCAASLREDRVLRFWWLATLLAVLPVAASFPSDRLLILVNVGAMAIVARTLMACWRWAGSGFVLARAFALGLLSIHALLSPLLLPWRARQMQQLAAATERAFACLDEIENLEQRTLIVLGAPTDFFVSYLQVERSARGVPQPQHVYWVTNPGTALHVRALDRHTLQLVRRGGFFNTPPEALYRSRQARLEPGQRLVLPQLEARIGSVDAAGSPRRIELQLTEPLDAERYVFLGLAGTSYRRLTPEQLQDRRIPPAIALPELLVRSQNGLAPIHPESEP